jgi:PAS domain S-box-containing protein
MKKSDKTNNTKTRNISSASNQTEEKLKASEERFHLLCEAAEEGIIIHDNGIIIEANQAMARMFGYELSEMIGKNAEVGVTSESWKVVLDNAATGYDKPYEITGVRKDGSTFTCSVVGKPYKYRGRSLRVVLFRDVTERKKAEELLQKSEARYRLLADNMTEHVWLMDLNLQTTYISPSVEKIYGYTWKEMLKLPFKKILTAESLQKVKEILSFEISNALANPPHPDYKFLLELECRHKDGHLFWIEDTISFIQDEKGKPLSILGETRDITERKLAEESLKKSEAQYRLLADHMKDQVWIMDLDLKITYISPSVERLMGYTLEEIRKLSLDKILTVTSLQTAIDFFSEEMPRALAAPSDYILNRSLELEFIRKNGQTIWGESTFSFIRDENARPVSILGEGRNITERRQMEDSLRKSEENFRHSLDDSPLGVRISTIEGETIYANRAILDMYGYDSLEELKKIQLKDRYTPQSFAEFQIRKEKRLKGELGPSEYEINIVRKDGEIRHLYVFRKEIFWNGKKQSQVIYQDITLRRQAEEKLSATLENLRRSIRVTIQVLGTASEARDPYTAGHQKRVANLARAIATEMKLPHDKIEAIRMAAAIHDIGKISVPSEILCKPSMLTNLEFSFIKAHPEQSYEIIKDVESPWPLADIVRQHHERIDGSGYPQGLKNKDILIEARILAVADVVEAMMSYRPYRPALGVEIALAEIENNTGTLYDRDAVDACLRLFRVKNYQIT